MNLACSNKTWDETIFVTWEIFLDYKEKNCKITFAPDDDSKDTCQDGKSLRNTSSSQSYLHIPNFSHKDVGVYKCQSPYKGGSYRVQINVALTGRIDQIMFKFFLAQIYECFYLKFWIFTPLNYYLQQK